MNLPPLTRGKLIRRYKRFLADVALDDGTTLTAHVPNTGSMMSTREPGSEVGLSYHGKPTRKLKWTLEIIRPSGCSWVGVNTMLPNRIVEEGITNQRIPSLCDYDTIRREVKYGDSSRIDLLLEKDDKRCYVEVKNVTYRENDNALFPDAVTTRGAKHLKELEKMVEQGHRSVIFFFVNRSDCVAMGPADDIDPVYGAALRSAVDNGVEALAFQARVTPELIEINKPLPIIL